MDSPDIKLKPLKGYNAFAKFFKAGAKVYSKNAASVICFRGQCKDLNIKKIEPLFDSDVIFYGVTVSRKRAKKAVVRNRIKRLLRESLRQSIENYIDDAGNPQIKIIIITWTGETPQHPMLIRLDDVKPAVEEILKKADKLYNEKFKGLQHN